MNLTKITNLTFSGIDTEDYPEFCDAYVDSAEWEDGTPLTEQELEDLTLNHADFWYEDLMESLR